MKVKVALTKDISRLTPRHVRNFIGSIAENKHKDYLMYHGKKLSPVIYPYPHRNGFEVVFAKSDDTAKEIMGDIAVKLNNVLFYGMKIKFVAIDDEDYILPVPNEQMSFYKSKTPFILAVNTTEYAILKGVISNDDNEGFVKFITRRIKDSISFQAREYLGKSDFFSLPQDDFQVYMQTSDKPALKNIRYKGINLPSIYLSFISNIELPEFIGYKVGLGYGQIKKMS